MPPPVVGFTRPAASPTASSLGPKVLATGPSGRILRRGSGHPSSAMSNRERTPPANAPVRHGNRSHARRTAKLGAGGAAAIGKRLIEPGAIDDRGVHAIALHGDRTAVRRHEARRLGGVEDRLTWDVELGEGLEAEQARAVSGNADARMLFEDHHVVTALGELARRDQPGGPRSNDDDVTQHRTIRQASSLRSSIFSASGFPCAEHANPK